MNGRELRMDFDQCSDLIAKVSPMSVVKDIIVELLNLI